MEPLKAGCGYIALLKNNGTENDVLFLDTGGCRCAVEPSLDMPIRGLRGIVAGSIGTASNRL